MNKLIRLLKGLIKVGIKKSVKRDTNSWLFGEWFGKRCCDNSMELANYIAEHHQDIKVIWSTNSGTDTSLLDKRIRVVYWNSQEAMEVYQNVGVVLMNQGFCDFSDEGDNYFAGALTINLWHGVMWKKIGHDGSKRHGWLYKKYMNVSDKLYGQNMYIATSERYADVCLTAFGAKEPGIIRTGLPRNALLYDKERVKQSKEELLHLCEDRGVHCDESTIVISYMPTFRDSVDGVFSIEKLSSEKRMKEWIRENNCIVIQKNHYVNRQNKSEDPQAMTRFVSLSDISAQTLLASTDILITDYSSCFFDYLLLDRPIIHFLYDYDFYVNSDRGVYYEKEDVVCGDVATTIEQLVDVLLANLENREKCKQLREKRRKEFMTYESASSCEDIYQAIIKRLATT